MKKYAIAILATGLVLSFLGTAQAQNVGLRSAPYYTAPIGDVYPTPQPMYRYSSQPGWGGNTVPSYRSNYPTWSTSSPVQRGGLFSELMELERRKNAWLRRTFLGQ
ncbi:hypothetical protein CA13_34250 [Planctomycetes bacterium CA13]|uniref:Uncharacterized protein n=1 Tax=Novipirellula herctigrandis TaxID=2527986 RepID=A0A5C5Z455_9BACT|nr:hypothetical protein CA13_34250 [Planctomycetes bacterium CA13]